MLTIILERDMSSIRRESTRYYFYMVKIFISFFEGCCNTKVPFCKNWSNKKEIAKEEIERDEENNISDNGNNTMNFIRFTMYIRI